MTNLKMIDMKEVLTKVGFKKTKMYNYINKGEFPKQIKDGRSSFWVEHEIDNWLKERHNLKLD